MEIALWRNERSFLGSAMAGVNRFLIFGMGRARRVEQIAPGALARVNPPARAQAFEPVEMPSSSLALQIGSKRAATIRAFLPLKPKPAEIFYQGVVELRSASGSVNILHPQYETSPGLAGTFLGNPEGPRMPKVEKPGGGGSDAAAVNRHEKDLTAKKRKMRKKRKRFFNPRSATSCSRIKEESARFPEISYL
jgi:hypothetical protein